MTVWAAQLPIPDESLSPTDLRPHILCCPVTLQVQSRRESCTCPSRLSASSQISRGQFYQQPGSVTSDQVGLGPGGEGAACGCQPSCMELAALRDFLLVCRALGSFPRQAGSPGGVQAISSAWRARWGGLFTPKAPLCISALPSPSCGPGCWGGKRAGTHMASSPPGQPAAGGVPRDRWGRETESKVQPLEPPHLWPPLGHTWPVSALWTLTQEAWMGGMNRCPDRGPEATRRRWSRHPLAPAFAVKIRSEATGAVVCSGHQSLALCTPVLPPPTSALHGSGRALRGNDRQDMYR